MKIVSGKTGTPHVTSEQFRQIIEGTVGQGSYILTSGENLEPELASNNMLKIRGGMMSHHGNISCVDLNTYDEVTLTNGSQGVKRIDLIVNRYTRNDETGLEKNEWVVIIGTPDASNPKVPQHTIGNLQNGDLIDDCPVFEVHYDGINVTEVKKLLPVMSNLELLNGKLGAMISGVRQTGTGGRIYAQRNGEFIDIDVVLSGCAVGTTYAWYKVGYVDLSTWGIISTKQAYGQAYFSGGGPAYGDNGGLATIRAKEQSSGRIQLEAQGSKAISEKMYIATIRVPIGR